jgi:CRISPR-associated protein Cas2
LRVIARGVLCVTFVFPDVEREPPCRQESEEALEVRFVVAYDISCDKRRHKVADVMLGVLTRVQLSVFEGEAPREVLDRAIRRALEHIDPTADSIRVYALCASCTKRTDIFGRGILPDTAPVRVF